MVPGEPWRLMPGLSLRAAGLSPASPMTEGDGPGSGAVARGREGTPCEARGTRAGARRAPQQPGAVVFLSPLSLGGARAAFSANPRTHQDPIF